MDQPDTDEMKETAQRYSRNIMLFGEEGQARIGTTTVGLVGVGGLGSHMAQQLAYLGVQHFVLVDKDIVTKSSLNRLIGSTSKDVGEAKVDVLAGVVARIQEGATVVGVKDLLQSPHSFRELKFADVLFGCLDDDSSRLALTEFASRHKKPFFDLATEIGGLSSKPWYGGRVVFSDKGDRCLVCLNVLDPHSITRAGMTPTQKEEEDRLYGIERSHLAETGPSVVSLNGVVASITVTEFMVWRTGLRDAWPYLVYRGDLGRVTLNTDPPKPDCYYCKVLRGSSEFLK